MWIQCTRAEELIENGGLFRASTALADPIFSLTNGRCDRDRKVVGNYLIESLCKSNWHFIVRCLLTYMPEYQIPNHSDHFPWGKWCEVALTHKLTLHGWPRRYHSPGPGFDYKRSVTSEGWKDLAGQIPVSWKNNPLRDDALPELKISPWTMGKSAADVCMYRKADIDLDDHQCFEDANTAGEIGLVMDDNLNPLHVVADTKAFDCGSKAKAKAKANREQHGYTPRCQEFHPHLYPQNM